MQRSTWIALGLVLATFGCKKDDDKTSTLPEGTLAGKTYSIITSGTLTNSATQLAGSGAIVFHSPLDEIRSKDSFALNFTVADGGTLELVTHSDADLQNGVSVLFSRTADELTLSLKADGSGTDPKVLEGVKASEALAITVDVHNDESPSHILVWNAAAGAFGEADALFNSEEDEEAPGTGKAQAWGLLLDNAVVTGADRGAPKFSEK